MKKRRDSRKKIDGENMSAGKPIINQSLPENAEIKTPENEKEIKNKENIIRMKFKIEEKDVGKATKILYNIRQKIEGCDLNELNETNTELYINNKKHKYKTYIIPEKEGFYDIKIKINTLMKSCCCLFYSINNLQSIDLSSFNAENVSNMSYMFYGCNNLEGIDLSSFNAPNVINISKIFGNCINLKYINLSKFNAQKITNIVDMFYECNNLESIDLSSFNAPQVTNLSNIFCSSKNIKNINLSSFNAPNVTNMSNMFHNCKNLENINFSSFSTQNVTNMSGMFSDCENLKVLDLSKFKTQNVIYMRCFQIL